jgi:hypothetical protein
VETAKSAGFNSPQLAALRLNLFLIDTPWLAAGNFILILIVLEKRLAEAIHGILPCILIAAASRSHILFTSKIAE